MRTAAALVVLSIATSAGAESRDLEPQEIRAHLKDADREIAACYRKIAGDRVGAGHLAITLAIHRKGQVDRIDISAPALPARLVTKLDGCVRHALDGVVFPARRNGTTAVVPYLWQKTAAGPR